MKKLLIVLIMALCMISAALAEGETFTEGMFEYTLTEEGAVVTDCSFSETAPDMIIVPETLGGQPVVGVGRLAFARSEWDGSSLSRSFDSIRLPETVTFLEENAFTECMRVDILYLPASLECIPEETFVMCFAEVAVAEGNPHFTSADGFLIDTRTGTLLYTSPSSAGRPLPAVRRLGAFSLYHWAALDANVVIPEGVEEIGPAAFYDVSVDSLQLPQSLRRIETDAFFAFDVSDGRVVIPAGVEVVEFAAFGSGYVDGVSGLEYWHLTLLPESESTRFETAQEYEARTGDDSFAWWYD